MQTLRAIMVGDVVGDPGLDVLRRRLPYLIKEYEADFVMVNGENAAAGFGLTGPLLEQLFAAGADVVSSGNHIWEKREFFDFLKSETRILRPLNYPAINPGRGWVCLEKTSAEGGKVSWIAVNLQGRELMPAMIDCPFRAFDALETVIKTRNEESGAEKPIILVDFHAESSREKESLAYYLDGRASVIAGTHTHVQTADERILPKGAAYITDLGMTGVLAGIIGMDPKICLDRARNQVLYRMEVAAPDTDMNTSIQGIVAEIDGESGKALSIKRFSA